MGSLIFGGFLAILGLAAYFIKVPAAVTSVKNIVATGAILGGGLFAAMGGVSYNDAGQCQHIRTVMGTETSTCDTGWYFLGWGASTQWPHFITVAHTLDPASEGSSIDGPYSVRLADNWNGDITQATRFGIPQDNETFLKMARDFRAPGRLISTTLRPAVTSSLDSVANLFSMEDYYAGGMRDQFKTEYRDAITLGRAEVHQVITTRGLSASRSTAAATNMEGAEDTSTVDDEASERVIMEKVLVNGLPVRQSHGYMDYGIQVSSAIIENLDPADLFEAQIQARMDAASRRIVAQEERKEQDEQQQLAIARGATQIATRQAEAQVIAIERTTNAETERQLAVIDANRIRQQAAIAAETATIRLGQARTDAETQETLADAEAYEKRVLLEADNALTAKLDAWVAINASWAQAAADINVPTTVFSSGGGDGASGTGNFSSVQDFMDIMTMRAASSLDVNTAIN
jgi:regulator of protease activity HflC (stomatin/prohibitin superfamily)